MCCLEEDGTSYLAAMNIDDGKFLKQNLELDASVSLLDFGFAPDNSCLLYTSSPDIIQHFG